MAIWGNPPIRSSASLSCRSAASRTGVPSSSVTRSARWAARPGIGLAVGTEHVCVRENSIATKHFAFIDRVQANGTNASMRYSGPACIGARAARTRWQVSNVLQHTMPIQDEHARLRKRIVGMRTTLLLFAKDPRAASGLRDLIAE